MLLIPIVGAYFFTRGEDLDDLTVKKNQLQDDLTVAKDKLNKETEILDTMTSDLRRGYPVASSVQDQMSKASDLVRRTDFIFTNPSGSNPKIIVKNPLTDISIDAERVDINMLLAEWQKETTVASMATIDLNKIEKIKKDAETIKRFINDLSKITASLTPENSGLSQFQIATYSAMLPSLASIDAVLNSLSISIENSTNNQIPQTSPNIPVVTVAEVVQQQAVVAQIEATVVAVQEQITQTEVQIQQISLTPTPIPTPTPTPTPTPNPTPTPTPTPTPITDPGSGGTDSEGTIFQSGEPELIQGTNPY